MNIKPCPFCGSEAKVYTGGFGEKYVSCTNNNCGGSLDGGIWFTTDEKAIEIWNKRPPVCICPDYAHDEACPVCIPEGDTRFKGLESPGVSIKEYD